MKGYCAVVDIENYTLTEIETTFETNVQGWISVVEQYIDNETGRNFKADASASKRYYDGNDLNEFYVDECVEVSGLVIKNSMGDTLFTLTKDTHYLTYPYNELPIRKLIAKSYNVLGFISFLKGQKNIELTAKWGYSVDVPDGIKFATMILVSGIVNFSNNSEGEIKSEKIGDYQVSYKDDQWKDFELAKKIIGQFTKYDV
ncbi:MAG TPA: hypothetical protein DDY21_00240 [Candidatus Moranbacteria bacterium]|nr:hypothetical protein [Candidatus Moranbacteria bacterium]